MLDKVIYISRLAKNTQLAHNRADMIFYWTTGLGSQEVLKPPQWKNKNMNATQTAVIFVSCGTDKDCEHKERNISAKISVTFFKSTKHWYLRKETRWSSMQNYNGQTREFLNILEMTDPKLTDAISPANERIQTTSRFSTSAVSLILLLGRTKKLLESAISRIL